MTISEIEEVISQMNYHDFTDLEREIPHLITKIKSLEARLALIQGDDNFGEFSDDNLLMFSIQRGER